MKIPEKDRDLLESIGFDIKGLVGFGTYGTVYHGFYRFIALGEIDIKGKHLDITPSQEFACKTINIKSYLKANLLREILILLLTELSHPNIVNFHMCINLGNCQFITLDEVRLRAS